jgi:hypothetical protein
VEIGCLALSCLDAASPSSYSRSLSYFLLDLDCVCALTNQIDSNLYNISKIYNERGKANQLPVHQEQKTKVRPCTFSRAGMCVGYEMTSNPEIFRPIFCPARQCLLEQVHLDIIGQKFWKKVKSRYYVCLSKIRRMPLECIAYVVNFIY